MMAPSPEGSQKKGLLLMHAAALLWGLQFAFLGPALAVYLTSAFGATAAQVGLVLALYNASGFIASLVVPMIADRRREYLGVMVACGVFAIILATALALAPTLPVAAGALIVLGGPAGAGGSLLFAHVNASGYSRSVVMGVRAMSSIAWVAGPPLAMLLAGFAGIRSVLIAMAVVAVTAVALVAVMKRQHGRIDTPAKTTKDSSTALPLARTAIVMLAFVALHATNATMTSMMTLFASTNLGLDLAWGGVALAVAALLEVPGLFLLGKLSGRYGPVPLMAVGIISGILFFLSMTVVDGVAGLLAAQVLNAWFVATISGVGLTWFMGIIPRPGLASGLFMNTYRVGAISAGALVAISGTSSGFPGMFMACAGLATLALVVILVLGRRSR